MKKVKILALIVTIAAVWMACKKDNAGTTPVIVRLTDAPGNFQQVNVDITGVEFKVNNDAIVNLNVVPGVYNLLDYVNGLDVLIASADVPSGKLSQIRLILGTNNTVKVDDVVCPLSTPSAMQSGLKLNVNSTLTPGVEYSLLLDFDAKQSIVLTGNGVYQLKPVIKVVDEAISGSISGRVVTTLALPASITATDGTNTYSTSTAANGGFLLRGVAARTYTVTVTPTIPLNSGYTIKTFNNVSVTVGNLKELGAMTF